MICCLAPTTMKDSNNLSSTGADYSDEISDEYFEALKELVKDEIGEEEDLIFIGECAL